jgi:hypothetical protein
VIPEVIPVIAVMSALAPEAAKPAATLSVGNRIRFVPSHFKQAVFPCATTIPVPVVFLQVTEYAPLVLFVTIHHEPMSEDVAGKKTLTVAVNDPVRTSERNPSCSIVSVESTAPEIEIVAEDSCERAAETVVATDIYLSKGQ